MLDVRTFGLSWVWVFHHRVQPASTFVTTYATEGGRALCCIRHNTRRLLTLCSAITLAFHLDWAAIFWFQQGPCCCLVSSLMQASWFASVCAWIIHRCGFHVLRNFGSCYPNEVPGSFPSCAMIITACYWLSAVSILYCCGVIGHIYDFRPSIHNRTCNTYWFSALGHRGGKRVSSAACSAVRTRMHACMCQLCTLHSLSCGPTGISLVRQVRFYMYQHILVGTYVHQMPVILRPI